MNSRQIFVKESPQARPAMCSWHHSVVTEQTEEQCRHESRRQLEGSALCCNHTIAAHLMNEDYH